MIYNPELRFQNILSKVKSIEWQVAKIFHMHGMGGQVVSFTKYPYHLDTLSYYAKSHVLLIHHVHRIHLL